MSTPSDHTSAPSKGERTLTQRFLTMSVWNILQILSQMIMRLASNLILTRLLLPEAFGLMAFAMTIQIGATMLTDIGVERSIIRDKEGDTTHFLRAAWTVRVIRGATITGVMLVIALGILPLLAPLFDPDSVLAAPETPWVTAIISFAPLLKTLCSANEVVAHRQLNMRRVVILEVLVQILGLIIMVSLAFVWPAVWSLALGTLAMGAVKAVATHLFLPGPRMAFVWDRPIAQRLWDYGKWLIGSSVFGFVGKHSEKLIIAGMIDVTLFGLYSIARLWAEAAQSLLFHVLNSAGMAALSEIMRTPGRDVVGPFGRIQRNLDVLIILGFLAFFWLSGPFIAFIYPTEFDGAAIYAPWLSLLFLRVRFAAFDSLLLSSGQTRTIMACSAQSAVGVIILVPIAMSSFGLKGAIIAFSVSQLINVPTLLLASKRTLSTREFGVDWGWFVGCVLLCILAIWRF